MFLSFLALQLREPTEMSGLTTEPSTFIAMEAPISINVWGVSG
jgi:hypothetical protein